MVTARVTWAGSKGSGGIVNLDISDSVRRSVDSLGLRTRDKYTVCRCVSRYSLPSNVPGYCRYVSLRVWNAVRALFGSSDWQKALNVLVDKERELVEAAPLVLQRQFTEIVIREVAEDLLRDLIQINEGRVLLRDLLERWNCMGGQKAFVPC